MTRIANVTRIVNDSAVRVLSPKRGFFKLTYIPLFDNDDLFPTRIKCIWDAAFDESVNSQFLRCYYVGLGPGTGRWKFLTTGGFQAEMLVTGAEVLTKGTEYVIICRWTSADISEHDQVGQALDLWVNGVKATQLTARPENLAGADCNVYLGSSLNLDSNHEYADGHLRFATIDIRCPTEEELLRI